MSFGFPRMISPKPPRDVVAVPGARDVDDAPALGEPPEVDARRPVQRVADRRLPPLGVEVGEEEGAVPDERAADARPLLPVEEGRDGHVVDAAADQPLVAAVEVGGAAETVRAAAGDDVDAAAREAALAHVVGRHHELQLADRVEADRLGVGLASRRSRPGQPEQVVVDWRRRSGCCCSGRSGRRPSGSSRNWRCGSS